MANKYRYKSKNPKNTYEYVRNQLREVDINDLRTEQQLLSYIQKSAELIEEESRRALSLLRTGRTTTGQFSSIKVDGAIWLQRAHDKAVQLLDQEYIGADKSQKFNYLKQEAGKARQLLGYKTATYQETVREYDNFIQFIKKYGGREISYKEAEQLAKIIEDAYTSPTSRFVRLNYVAQTKEIVETIEQLRGEDETFLDALKNKELVYKKLGIIVSEDIKYEEVDDEDVIPIFKGND